MASYEDWNKLEDGEEEELQDLSWFEGKRDVILFCIDCSESMHELRDDQNYEDVKTCHLLTALEGAMLIQKKKVIVGPNDAVGILLFNTTAKNERSGQASEIKRNTYVLQPIETINAPKVQELMLLIDAARQDPDHLRKTFPPLQERSQVPLGDVFTSCNWVIRDGAPKTATKRVFLVTDQDDPHPGTGAKQLVTSARTTLIDLTQSGVTVEPFFISSDEKSFDPSKFYSSVLLPDSFGEDEDEESSSILPESISISRIDDLLSQMRFREIPKRSQFNIPFELYNGFVIGVKGYGLVTEQKKGSYRYFVDLGDRMEVANVRTSYVDEDRETEAEKAQILYGMDLGATADANDEPDDDSGGDGGGVPGFGVRAVEKGSRPFYTTDEVRSFRTLGLEPGIKLLGFKDRGELLFEDNIKHSTFIYPDEFTYSGSRRTFSALLKSMIKKRKIGLVLTLLRRSSSPTFCAMLPQEECVEEGGWNEPPGFHLIPLPFADDIRSATVDEAFRASKGLAEAAESWIRKLSLKNGSGYPPDSYPNPALAYHNAQLEASAFREEFNEGEFEDLTAPKLDMMHKRAGNLLREWRELVANDESAHTFIATTGSKRRADISVDEAEIRSMYDSGRLEKLKVDQLKAFLRSKSENVSGKKSDLMERVGNWLNMHQ